jgi:Protein of unknown function (DUF4054)
MTDINQSFSVYASNDTDVLYDLSPDADAINLEFVESLTWTAYPQVMGVPDMTLPLITKAVGTGIEITDPLLMQFTVTLAGEDTAGLAGNYYYDIRLVANHGELTTTTVGLMTVIDPAVVPNVSAFKAMFPEFAGVDDTTVQIALDMAGQFVDDSWDVSEGPATMWLAAHFMALSQSGAGASTGVGRVVSSETIGRISVSYASGNTAAATTSGALGSTTYGLVFNQMLTAQGTGIAIC